MSRPTVRAAVEWIAYNDEPGDRNVESVAGFISTLLAADLFGMDATKLATKIVKYRIARSI